MAFTTTTGSFGGKLAARKCTRSRLTVQAKRTNTDKVPAGSNTQKQHKGSTRESHKHPSPRLIHQRVGTDKGDQQHQLTQETEPLSDDLKDISGAVKINIMSRNLPVNDQIKSYVLKKVANACEHFESAIRSVDVKIYQRGDLANVYEAKTQVIVYTKGQHGTIVVEETNPALWASIDVVADKVERQLRRQKEKYNQSSRHHEPHGQELPMQLIESAGQGKVQRSYIDGKPLNPFEIATVESMDLGNEMELEEFFYVPAQQDAEAGPSEAIRAGQGLGSGPTRAK